MKPIVHYAHTKKKGEGVGAAFTMTLSNPTRPTNRQDNRQVHDSLSICCDNWYNDITTEVVIPKFQRQMDTQKDS